LFQLLLTVTEGKHIDLAAVLPCKMAKVVIVFKKVSHAPPHLLLITKTHSPAPNLHDWLSWLLCWIGWDAQPKLCLHFFERDVDIEMPYIKLTLNLK